VSARRTSCVPPTTERTTAGAASSEKHAHDVCLSIRYTSDPAKVCYRVSTRSSKRRANVLKIHVLIARRLLDVLLDRVKL